MGDEGAMALGGKGGSWGGQQPCHCGNPQGASQTAFPSHLSSHFQNMCDLLLFPYLTGGFGKGSLLKSGQYLLHTRFEVFGLGRYSEVTAHLSQYES